MHFPKKSRLKCEEHKQQIHSVEKRNATTAAAAAAKIWQWVGNRLCGGTAAKELSHYALQCALQAARCSGINVWCFELVKATHFWCVCRFVAVLFLISQFTMKKREHVRERERECVWCAADEDLAEVGKQKYNDTNVMAKPRNEYECLLFSVFGAIPFVCLLSSFFCENSSFFIFTLLRFLSISYSGDFLFGFSLNVVHFHRLFALFSRWRFWYACAWERVS